MRIDANMFLPKCVPTQAVPKVAHWNERIAMLHGQAWKAVHSQNVTCQLKNYSAVKIIVRAKKFLIIERKHPTHLCRRNLPCQYCNYDLSLLLDVFHGLTWSLEISEWDSVFKHREANVLIPMTQIPWVVFVFLWGSVGSAQFIWFFLLVTNVAGSQWGKCVCTVEAKEASRVVGTVWPCSNNSARVERLRAKCVGDYRPTEGAPGGFGTLQSVVFVVVSPSPPPSRYFPQPGKCFYSVCLRVGSKCCFCIS